MLIARYIQPPWRMGLASRDSHMGAEPLIIKCALRTQHCSQLGLFTKGEPTMNSCCYAGGFVGIGASICVFTHLDSGTHGHAPNQGIGKLLAGVEVR